MDKTFSPSYSSSQITYVETEDFSRFRFRRNRTASASTSLDQTVTLGQCFSRFHCWEPFGIPNQFSYSLLELVVNHIEFMCK